MKKIKLGFDGGGHNISVNEAQLLQKIKHRNVVRYVDCFMSGEYLYLIMEFCDKGDMDHYIRRAGKSLDIPENRIWKFLLQMCSSLNYIHNKGIVHGDLKP